jgi:hypothetical protein
MHRILLYGHCCIILIISFSLVQCKPNRGLNNNCYVPYTLSDLFKDNDSSRFEILKVGKWTRVWDKGNINSKSKDRGFYSFDQNNILRLHVFFETDSSFQFGIKFDSLGRKTEWPDKPIVQWILGPKNKDSMRVTFLVFQINRSYGHLKFILHNDTISARLFDRKYYSNVAASEMIIGKKDTAYVIRLVGSIRNDCSGKI